MQQLYSFFENKKHIIWDWNGTLLDDVDTCVLAISRILTERGLPPLQVERYREVFGFPISSYYERIGLIVDPIELVQISDSFHSHYADEFRNTRLHNGVNELLTYVKKAGLTQSILSAAQENWLFNHLEVFEITHHFDHVFGLSDFLASSKIERGRQLLERSGIEQAKTLLVGDTDHDVEVGRELGIDVVILADGHQSRERFNHLKVPVLTRKPRGGVSSEGANRHEQVITLVAT